MKPASNAAVKPGNAAKPATMSTPPPSSSNSRLVSSIGRSNNSTAAAAVQSSSIIQRIPSRVHQPSLSSGGQEPGDNPPTGVASAPVPVFGVVTLESGQGQESECDDRCGSAPLPSSSILSSWPLPMDLPSDLLDLPSLLSGSGTDRHGRPRSPTSAIAAAFSTLQDTHAALCNAYITTRALYIGLREEHLSRPSASGQASQAELARLQAENASLLSAAEQGASLAQQLRHAVDEEANGRARAEAELRDSDAARAGLYVQVQQASSGLGQAQAELGCVLEREALAVRRAELAEDLGRAHASEAASAHSSLAALRGEHDSMRRECEAAKRDATDARTRNVALAAQASAASLSLQELRRELALERAESARVRDVGAGRECERCRHFDLPDVDAEDAGGGSGGGAQGKDIAYYRSLLAPRVRGGPWYSVEAVRGALSDAAALRLVVLAPTVRISINQGTGSASTSGGGSLDALAGAPVSALAEVLEQDVLPRFAAVFAVPRLQLKGQDRPAVIGSALRAGVAARTALPLPDPGADLDGWLRSMVVRMEEDVRTALDDSGLFKGQGVVQNVTGAGIEVPGAQGARPPRRGSSGRQ